MAALEFEWHACSEIAGRPVNEDRVLGNPRLVAVADGVGGSAAGEVASQLAVGSLVSLVARYLEEPLDEALTDAVRDGNARIAFVGSCRARFAGMATTVSSAALSDEGDFVVANIGDSRTYLLRDGRLVRLTRDDTFVQHLLDLGEISTAEARVHPGRSVVVNVLDGAPDREPALTTLAASAGDRVLVCTDGLSDYVDDSAIADALSIDDRRACSEVLVSEAIRAGGSDNVSLVVADVLPRRDAGSAWIRPAD
jgi:protein phosphatase